MTGLQRQRWCNDISFIFLRKHAGTTNRAALSFTSQEKRCHLSAQCLWLWFQFCCHCMCFSSKPPEWMVQPLPFHCVCKNSFTSVFTALTVYSNLKVSPWNTDSAHHCSFLVPGKKIIPNKKGKKWSLENFHNIERFSTLISAWKKYFLITFVSKHTSNTH